MCRKRDVKRFKLIHNQAESYLDAQHISVFYDALQNKNAEVREMAGKLLLGVLKEKALPHLEKAYSSLDANIRKSVISVLGEACFYPAKQLIEKAANDMDEGN